MRETDNSENLEGTAASLWVFTWLIACLAWKPTVPARQYTAASQTDTKGSDVRDQRGSTAPEQKCTEETYFSENRPYNLPYEHPQSELSRMFYFYPSYSSHRKPIVFFEHTLIFLF